MKTSTIGVLVDEKHKKTSVVTKSVPDPVFQVNTHASTHFKSTHSTHCKTLISSTVKPLILGSVDGLITSFVIIAGGIAGDVSKNAVMIIGFSSLFADAFSMGTSEYLSSRTQSSFRESLLFGIVCFSSFAIFGAIPLLGYSFAETDFEFGISLSLFLFSLLSVSLLRTYIVSSSNIVFSILEILGLGSVAGAIAYGVASISHEIY